jgi:hypothetical protein
MKISVDKYDLERIRDFLISLVYVPLPLPEAKVLSDLLFLINEILDEKIQ